MARPGMFALVSASLARSAAAARVAMAASVAMVASVAIAASGCATRESDAAKRAADLDGASRASAEGLVAGSAAAAVSFGPPAPPAAPALDRPLRVIIGGDLLPHRPSLVAPASIHAALAPLGPLFGQADVVVANYEAATGEVDPKAFRLAYAAPPAWLDELPHAGVRAITVANNHACDLGAPGLEATLEAASHSGLLALGAGAAADDPWAPRALVEQNGKRICAVSWTTLSNAEGGCSRSRHLAVAPLTLAGKQRIDRAMATARSMCDATIAIFHGGQEYAPQTTLVMEQAVHAAEAGADAVVIHHPHVASPVVVVSTRDHRQVPLFASVGNLVTNQGESWKPPMFPVLPENRHLVCVNGWTRLGVLADLAFTFDAATPSARPRLDWGTHLVWVDNEHAEDHNVATPKIAARLLEPAHDEAIIDALSKDRRGPLALFTDPCWLERVAPDAPAARDPRCTNAVSAGARAGAGASATANASASASASTTATASAITGRAAKRATSRRKK